MTISREFAESMMRRAVELAERGIGYVEPNPPVGAVVVNDAGDLLGEGWHQQYGGPHAEVHALNAAGESARGANLFVTLEPCCHFGKTPPCSRAVIAAGIRKVFIGTQDPAPHVDGGGIRELLAAGIEVETGLLSKEAKQLIAPFVQLQISKRPWFHGKWAMSLDGKIATRTGDSKWISNETSRAVVHRLRGRMDAILVGIGTALADDPLLTARPQGPRTAIRIVVDSKARLPLDSQLVKTASQIPVIAVVTASAPQDRQERLRQAGVDVVPITADAQGRPLLLDLASELGRRRLTHVLIEGGGEMLGAYFDANLVDEVHAFIAPKLIGGKGAKSPVLGVGIDAMTNSFSLIEPISTNLDGDIYIHGRIRRYGSDASRDIS